MKKPLIILTGPTAVGKTKLSIALAKAVNGEIISCDSMQVYKHMDIGSAKIKPEEMEGVVHYLIDILEPQDDFNVVKFQEFALKAMNQIYSKGKVPILVGGTGFYIQAIVKNIDFEKTEENSSYRDMLQAIAEEKGSIFLHDMLKAVDEESAFTIHHNNIKRVIRALEFHHQTGDKFSQHNNIQKDKISPYNFAYFVLNDHRELLYQRINTRIDDMLHEGLIKEVIHLKDMGCRKDMISMQGLGYKEILSYLDGNCSLEEAIEILKRDTRHFAKRQLTWFRREPVVDWIFKPDFNYDENVVLNHILSLCKEKEIL